MRILLLTICLVILVIAAPISLAADSPEVIGAERTRFFQENAWIIPQITLGGGFGNSFSFQISNQMYNRTNQAANEAAREGLQIESLGRGSWAFRFPIVNVAVFETSKGLVLVDSGYAPAGPALLEALQRISNKKVHSIILTHHHIDHALGAWALIQDNPDIQIIATEAFVEQQQIDLDFMQNITRLTHQSPAAAPKGWEDVTRPTRTFSGALDLRIGGVRFELRAARGETADQLYVHVPSRDILVVADYYQRFIPNAGNGRRRVRFIGEWSEALMAMAALGAGTMIPMHGPVLTDKNEIKDRLSAHAAILKSINQQVQSALNANMPKHQIADSVRLPAEFSDRDDVRELYVSVQDVAKMALHRHTGWWNGIASEWNGPSASQQATELVALAGGVDALLQRARAHLDKDMKLACHLADQALFAEPQNPEALQASYHIYLTRLFKDKPPIQEALVYIDHLIALRYRLKDQGITP